MGLMMTGRDGERLGACTDRRRFWAKYRSTEVNDEEIKTAEGKLATTAGTWRYGHRQYDGVIAEALGMMLLGTVAIPAVHATDCVPRRRCGSGGSACHPIRPSRDHSPRWRTPSGYYWRLVGLRMQSSI